MLPPPHNLAQPSPHAIPHYRSTDSSGRNESHAKSFLSFHLQSTEREEGSADCFPFDAHLVELPRQLQPSLCGKSQAQNFAPHRGAILMRCYRNVTKARSNLPGRRAILACHAPELV